jgi:hypothetical protein
MILANAPQHEAIVSNVGQIGEFRIRNSAKAFSILSSGLYANKIRAIVRELSCNAVDSHVAACKKDVPFEVHMPNSLEPHFSIRDFGTGLSHDQVTQIYTTYFESTKTDSNEFIGALGLGSKSPFAYTDNFTVTAIKDGSRRIYTAFINETGVPSIALMTDNDTDEANGVEVKFSVNDRWDFDKFATEARNVYTHFALRPIVRGAHGFQFFNTEYESKDIVPGVHSYKGGRGQTVAVMGNIAYPISIPQASLKDLGAVANLLQCGLEMHFGIGDLDFQASREGLSYIPSTIAAIRIKLEALNSALTVVLSKEADAIDNLWERAVFLYKKKESPLWAAAVLKYVKDTKLATWDDAGHYQLKHWKFKADDLAKDYNIVIKGISKSRGYSAQTMKPTLEYAPNHAKDANGNYITWQQWSFGVSVDNHYVINDTKAGATERAKYHYRETTMDVHHRNVYILEKADKTKAMNTKAFFLAMQSPPERLISAVSSLKQKEREGGMGKNVTILSLQKRGGRGYRHDEQDMVWRDAGKANSFDAKTTFYYVPLSGFSMLSTKGYTSGKQMYEDVKSLPGLFNGEIYGVRKADIDDIKKRPNWKNFEEHIAEVLAKKDISNFMLGVVKSKLKYMGILDLSADVLSKIDVTSPYKNVVETFAKVQKFNGSMYNVEHLFNRFAPSTTFSPDALTAKYQAEINAVNKRYPLLPHLTSYTAQKESTAIADYIKMVDKEVGI